MSKNIKAAPPLSETEIILRKLLADGPRNSREAISELAARGFTAKQVRRARERQGVVMARDGFGPATRMLRPPLFRACGRRMSRGLFEAT